ncbi:MAG: hypothetical protein JNM78_17420 [Cyclobacteriaceae bacterium]|nr:hypothetical protein [Cyclobacteriaceae bacterium]
MKPCIIFIFFLNIVFNVLGQLGINSNKTVAEQLDQFETNLKNDWDTSKYYNKSDYTEVCKEIVIEYRRFSNEAIIIAYYDGSGYYYKYILGQQNLAREYGVGEVEIYFQDFLLKLLPKDITREEREKEKAKLYTILGNTIDAIDSETNDRIATIYSAYKIKHLRYFPAKTDIFAKLHYGELDRGSLLFMNNSSLIFGPDLNAFTSNIVSGYLGKFPVRFSLATVIAKGRNNPVDSEELIGKTDAQIQEIVNTNYSENVKNNTLVYVLNGGGFLGFKAEYPILSYSNLNLKGKPQIELSLNAALSGQFEKAGGSISGTEADLFYYSGADLKSLLPFSEVKEDGKRIETFALFLSGAFKVIGGSKNFYKNLEAENTKVFSQVELSIGFLFNGVKIYYTYLYFTKPNLNEIYPSRVGITYVPSFF